MKGAFLMNYELSQEEINHIEKYRDLFDDFQKAADENMKTLFELQTSTIKQLL